jgi:hypothetical protein
MEKREELKRKREEEREAQRLAKLEERRIAKLKFPMDEADLPSVSALDCCVIVSMDVCDRVFSSSLFLGIWLLKF